MAMRNPKNKPVKSSVGKSAQRLLSTVASCGLSVGNKVSPQDAHDASVLLSADLIAREQHGGLRVTEAGLAHLARAEIVQNKSEIDPFLGQHLALTHREVDTATGLTQVAVDDCESPLGWLARRKGRDGRPMIEPTQYQAGERLRADFTRGQLMPRVTSNWSAAISDGRRMPGSAEVTYTEAVTAARQRVRLALEKVGPEFAGLLLDVCCFLKGLEDIERERAWPPRSAKVVLQLALGRLARHYGLSSEIRGRARAPIAAWQAPKVVEGED
jgi:hypothetical protein